MLTVAAAEMTREELISDGARLAPASQLDPAPNERPAIQCGIVFPSYIDACRDCEVTEDKGFSHAWFCDTQLLCADVWATMALADVHEGRMI